MRFVPQVLETVLEVDLPPEHTALSRKPQSDFTSAQNNLPHHQPDLRDFIVFELGVVERLPILLKYAEGMLLVLERVTEQFGGESVAKALDIVCDLIENRDHANGMGDEGDCWAAWRRDHRMHQSTRQNMRLQDLQIAPWLSQAPETVADHFPPALHMGTVEQETSSSACGKVPKTRPSLIRSAFSAENIKKTTAGMMSNTKLQKARPQRPNFLRSKSANDVTPDS